MLARALLTLLCMTLVFTAPPARAFQVGALTEAQQKKLDRNFRISLTKKKGPYTQNYCVCKDGKKRAVMDDQGRIADRCGGGNTRFCAAFRADWAKAIASEGMYIANIFSSDLYDWEKFPDKHNLVRGYILERFFVDTHPKHKLAEMKAYGGLSGAEYEARDMPLFFERYLNEKDFNDSRHFILAYELQKRFFVRNDWGKIQKIRNLASQIYARDSKFKPLRDSTHNQVSSSLIPRLTAYRDARPAGSAVRREVDTLINEIGKLTSLDESALGPQLAEIKDMVLRVELESLLPAADAGPVKKIAALGTLAAASRKAVAARRASAADRRRLVDINVTVGAIVQSVGSKLLDEGGPGSVRAHLALLHALVDASYGTGLLSPRERRAANAQLAVMLKREKSDREAFRRDLKKVERVVEWAHNGAVLAFGEVWAPWTYLLPDVIHIGDDIVRGSPMLLLGQVSRRLDDHLAGENRVRHAVFGKTLTTEVRALNPGLALGTLRVAPKLGGYARSELVALPETPADLRPAAGIVTRGEGNVVSHVQLLARALGIPNAVVANEVYDVIAPHDGEKAFMVMTPGGRVYLKKAAAMDARDKSVYEEFNRNTRRTGDGALSGGGGKLHIDTARLNVTDKAPMPLDGIRRKDSGIRSGPKAAFLGELKHLFPDNVARGVVVPFGSYYGHYQGAKLKIPGDLAQAGIAQAGEPLPDFAARTYDEFFKKLIPAGTSETNLAAWIQPRLAIMRYTIQTTPLAPALKAAIRDQLDGQGLLLPGDKRQSVGVFVRSDTNVEDQDNFNGAGLNLTLFNLKSLDDIYAGLKKVWASPFTYRSFSWRQTLIDEPLWVLPSVVILESVFSEKSGVLVTADIDTGDQSKMLIATSEGVGGAVDGTPAETLLWSGTQAELVTQFKSHYRRLLKAEGGSEIVPATGSD
ncbi:MAG: PEP/pyruvate-binding domain-containing protein, partial [Kiloniellaceae bacterium]